MGGRNLPADQPIRTRKARWKEGHRVIDWAGLRIAYETTAIPSGELSRRFNVHKSGIQYRAKREGWRRFVPLRQGESAPPAPPPPHLKPAIDFLRKRAFAVHREGSLYRVGTRLRTEAELLAIAERQRRAA